MIPLALTATVVLGLVGLLIAAALLARGLAVLLPALAGFLGDLKQIRAWTPAPTDAAPSGSPRPPVAEETARSSPSARATWYGVAPPPQRDDTSPTSATLPTPEPGDVDWFDRQAREILDIGRPIAPGSKMAAPPPGEPTESERR